MKEECKKIASKLKEYPLFPGRYHYMIDDVDFTEDDITANGYVYYDRIDDKIYIHYLVFDLKIPDHIFALLMSVMHECTHRIKEKRFPNIYDCRDGHGGIFQELCEEFGLDPKGETEGKGERDKSLPFYQWANERL